MKTAFARKISENAIVSRNSIEFTVMTKLIDDDKFALRAFNRLTHDRKINDSFVVNSLLDLSKYYISFKKMKRLVLSFFRKRFLTFLFTIVDSNASKKLFRFLRFKAIFCDMFHHYQ